MCDLKIINIILISTFLNKLTWKVGKLKNDIQVLVGQGVLELLIKAYKTSVDNFEVTVSAQGMLDFRVRCSSPSVEVFQTVISHKVVVILYLDILMC